MLVHIAFNPAGVLVIIKSMFTEIKMMKYNPRGECIAFRKDLTRKLFLSCRACN